MKAYIVDHYGKDGLRAAEVPEPKGGDGDVLVKVSAAGINPLDIMVRNGEFKRLLKYPTPFVLGHDVAGVVTKFGAAVRELQVGDEVYARPRDLRIGTFAQYIAIDQDDVALKPASLTLHEAAAVPLVSLAAWQALSSPSTSAPRWPRPRAARTPSWCTVSAPTSSWTTPRRTLPKSSPATTSCWTRSAARTSRIRSSRKVRKQARELGVSYSFLFMQANGTQLRELASLYDGGQLRPLIDKTFPFTQTLEALAYVEHGHANGKTVITLEASQR